MSYVNYTSVSFPIFLSVLTCHRAGYCSTDWCLRDSAKSLPDYRLSRDPLWFFCNTRRMPEWTDLKLVHYRLFPKTCSTKTYHVIAKIHCFVIRRRFYFNVMGVRWPVGRNMQKAENQCFKAAFLGAGKQRFFPDSRQI